MSGLVGGRYQLVRQMGAGSMGVVWLAHDSVLDRAVALKELRPPPGLDPDQAVARFLTEAQAAARLSHPSIVTVHDVFAEDARVLMSLELLDGPTLAEVIAAGPMDDAARPIMTGVAEALAAAHGQGVVHRDLKPDNVFVLPSGRVVVCDFGLARIGAGQGTHIGTVMGTPGYMAPEQIRGEETGTAVDVFAWGAVAYELVTGSPAFGNPSTDDFMALSWRVVHEEPPAIELPYDPAFATIVHDALAKDPRQRPANGDVLLRMLAGTASADPPPLHRGRPTVAPSGAAPAPSAGGRGTMAGLVAAVVVVLALVATMGVVLLSGPSSTEADLVSVTTRAPELPTSDAAEAPPSPLETATHGPGGPGSPEWDTFVIQVASRPQDRLSRADVERETSSYGYAATQLAVLDSGAYLPAMNPGYWVIYAGPYLTRTQAHDALSRLRGALPVDAHVRHLDQHCPKAPCT